MTVSNRISIAIMLLLLMVGSGFAQDQKASSEVDSRIWSMQYWKKMVDAGKVDAQEAQQVAPATFTGSRINSRLIETVDGPDVAIINATNTTQSENSVFVNPNDFFKAFNSNNSTPFPIAGIYGSSSFMTADGGATWTGSVQGTGGDNSGDPAAVINLAGRYIVGFIDDPGGQGVAYSDDEGVTWNTATVAPNPGSLADKNHLWVDNSPTSPFEGNLYAAWTDFGGPNDSRVVVSVSTDNGLTWSARVPISNGLPGFHQGVNVKTASDGTVYAFYTVYTSGGVTDEPAIGMTVSTDGGVTWGTATLIANNIRGIRSSGTDANMRVASFPVAAVDISGGPRDGNLYVVWPNIGVPGVNTGSDISVYMLRSTDGGSTWDTPIRVNQDPTGTGKESFIPWITCDPTTGALSVIMYSNRDVPAGQVEVFVSNSLDGGDSWEDTKISDVAFTPSPIPGLAGGYFGDYLSISAQGSNVYPVWTDNRTGNALAYTSPYVLADLTDPNGPTGVSAYSDYTTPTSIELNWTDPNSYVNGDPLPASDFTIEILRDGSAVASVAGGVQTYTDNGLIDGQTYSYTLFAKDVNDSLSIEARATWTAGGAVTPSAPMGLVITDPG
ncbi:MAG TPA: sialidase family protein, partial [Calditrichia bacterium]|nr:sialidase family protein [Calditrichia bacterium]